MKPMKPTQPTKPLFITYTGPSMNPTLRAGDTLHVRPYEGRDIRPGDVIVFRHPENGRRFAHRVISVDARGIRTQADRHRKADRFVLTPDHIIGRVIAVKRGSSQRSVWGGPVGRLVGTTLEIINTVKAAIAHLLYPLYERASKSGIVRRWIRGRLKIRVVSFERPGGKDLQLLLGHRLIGRRLPTKSHWHIRRPFRLFVDEASLPESPAKPVMENQPDSSHHRGQRTNDLHQVPT